MKSRSGEHQTDVDQQDKHHGELPHEDRSASALAGRSPYREEFQPDYGPDLDESLDATELRA